MTVELILKHNISESISAKETDDFLTVAKKLSENNATAVIVLDPSGGLSRLITEHDLVRAFAKSEGNTSAVSARDMMTKKVFVCSPGDTEIQLMYYMLQKGVRHMPVVESGKVLGIVSLSEAVRHRLLKINLLFEKMVKETDDGKRIGHFTKHLLSRRQPKAI